MEPPAASVETLRALVRQREGSYADCLAKIVLLLDSNGQRSLGDAAWAIAKTYGFQMPVRASWPRAVPVPADEPEPDPATDPKAIGLAGEILRVLRRHAGDALTVAELHRKVIGSYSTTTWGRALELVCREPGVSRGGRDGCPKFSLS